MSRSRVLSDRAGRARRILSLLKRHYPEARCSLNYSNPLQLLVATILSAQCTDARVNIVTQDLFRRFKEARDFAEVPHAQFEQAIQSTGFFRNKAKAIIGMAKSLVEKHQGKVPCTMEELVQLPGVGRKTANVVLGNAFGMHVGITVDTHVARLSQRLGLTKHTDPVKIELDLMQVVPRNDWTIWSHLLISHGRAICLARKPRCQQCFLANHCPTASRMLKLNPDRKARNRKAAS